ncbi:MAG: ABC transporter substrate-binding protein [Acidobacteriota bacterium]
MTRVGPWAAGVLLLAGAACLRRPTADPGVLVVAVQSGPSSLDPRLATDDASQKLHQLVFDNLLDLDDHLRIAPKLAARLEQPTPTTYLVTLKSGVRFHDGHELTSADVVYTFRSFLDPAFLSPRKGGYRELAAVDPMGRYAVRFTLRRPFTSFPANLIMPILPEGAGASVARHPIGTGPYRFVRYAPDDRVELARFAGYYDGPPHNDGVILKIVPDDVMRGLELRKGTTDIVVNDLTPDIVHQLAAQPRLRTVEAPGLDYQYLGLNLRDPALGDVRVRQALAHAIDTRAIIDYLRRGLATPASGLLPPLSWAFAPNAFRFPYDPGRARALLDAAGFPDPDGAGPAARLRLSLKISNTQEYNRLQAAVIQQNLRAVGIDLDVRTYEFATLYADVLKGAFQMVSLQWTAGSLGDPDILRRVFHSAQVPPAGFNRGYYSNPMVDALLDEAARATDDSARAARFRHVQEILAQDVPYVSLWNKRNVVVAQRSLAGVHVSAAGDFAFLKDVTRVPEAR